MLSRSETWSVSPSGRAHDACRHDGRHSRPYRADFHRTLELLAAGQIDEFAKTALGIIFSRDPAAQIPTSAVIRRILLRRIDKASAEEIDKYGANTRRLLNLPMVDTSSPAGRSPRS